MLPLVFQDLQDSDVVAQVDDRIYRHGEAPEGVTAPYVTWFVVTGTPENHLYDLPLIDRYIVQIDCWSDNDGDGDTGVETLAKAVRDALEPFHDMNGIVVNGKDAETKRYRIGMQFTWWEHRGVIPEPFTFVDQGGGGAGVALNTLITSAAVNITGIDDGTAISVVGGEYSINGGSFTAAAGTINDGDSVRVRHTSSGSLATATNTTLTVGSVSDTFTSTTIAVVTDPYFANVTTLLHFNGADGSTNIVDQIGGATITAFNGAALSTVRSKFGGSSLLLDGSNDYIRHVNAANSLTGDYTIEGWVFRVLNEIDGSFFSTDNVPSANFVDSGLYYVNGATIGWAAGGPAFTGVWTHVAISRNSGLVRTFAGGVLVGSGVVNGTVSMGDFDLGRYRPNNNGFFRNNIDEFRITKGVGRYTANFTPPTEPFPDA